jgi:hypothetical protein
VEEKWKAKGKYPSLFFFIIIIDRLSSIQFLVQSNQKYHPVVGITHSLRLY